MQIGGIAVINVAIVSPDHSLEPVDKVIAEHDFGCQFFQYVYRKMSDIDDIYQDCKGKCDVIFFSGELGYHYIKNKFPDIRIPCTFTAYEPIDVLSILLQFQIEHPKTPLNRVFCDFLTVTNQYMDVTQYIKKEECPYFFEDTHYDYRHITGYAKKLWDEGKIDLILSRSINNLKRLDELHIPYVAVFPSEEMIVKSIRSALKELRLNQMDQKDELNVLIRLPFTEDIEQEEQEYREATVYKMLADFRKSTHMHFSINQGFNQFELHAQLETGTFEIEVLRPLLMEFKKKLGFPFRIGAGLGSSKERSRYFSEHALLEANRYGRNDAFFVGEEGTVTGPLSADTKLIYNYSNEKALNFAREQGINETNILKLISMFEQDEQQLLNSHDLASLLGITPRSASRILSKLADLKLVRLTDAIHPEKEVKQGRPTHYYCFMSENFRNALL
jgi:CRP-like cAMP-binding protein